MTSSLPCLISAVANCNAGPERIHLTNDLTYPKRFQGGDLNPHPLDPLDPLALTTELGSCLAEWMTLLLLSCLAQGPLGYRGDPGSQGQKGDEVSCGPKHP